MSSTMRAAARHGQQGRRRPPSSGAGRVVLPALLLTVALLPFLLLLTPRAGYTVAPLAPSVPHPMARPPAVVTHTVRYDRYSLLLDNRRVMLFGGEYQFWRTPSPERWPVVLAEMRAAGLNTVSVGVSWQYHAPAPGVFDFSGIRDLGRFLDDAAAAGLYVIARPGPVYDAESNASNLPGWLLARAPDLRADSGHGYCGVGAYSPAYAAAYTDWYHHVLPIIAARQFTRGRGTVVALQIENEYNPSCGSAHYMRDLHDLARRAGVTVPLISNNNACCVAAGAWRTPGDDGQPIVDIPAEDDYPCTNLCTPLWNKTAFVAIDSLEQRMRAAGVSNAPVAVAELQGGYFTGWGQQSYGQLAATLGPAFSEVLDGSALGQGATLVSIYMAAGGTSWGYLGGPNTATSYDYAAPIHEWGAPGPAYAALKRTGMFVDAFGDLLGATERTASVTASNPRLLYAARQTVDGPQRGAQLIVLRNTDPTHSSATSLTLRLPDGSGAMPLGPGESIALPPHSLQLLVARYHLGPFYLRYSTSRPLTHMTIGGAEVAVLYGAPGTAGETALSFDRAPTITRLDAGVTARYDAGRRELLLRYRHAEGARYVALTSGGHRLTLLLTGPDGAARLWRTTTATGPALVDGPSMVTARGGALQVQLPPGAATPLRVWTARGLATPAVVGSGGIVHADVAAPRADAFAIVDSPSGTKTGTALVRQRAIGYDVSTGAILSTLTGPAPALRLPALTRWRFMPESPESQPLFDDAAWTPATERATSNPNVPPTDTLLADDYGYHYGFVWYRGTFTGTGAENGVRLFARHSYSVWLNGRYLGSSSLANDRKDATDELAVAGQFPTNATYADGLTFPIAPGTVKVGARNTIAVLVESLGHNIGFANGQLVRSPMGILSARLVGLGAGFVAPAIAWKLRGGNGATPLNASGLYGERNGWYRAGFDDAAWPVVTTPDDWSARGLRLQGLGWYRTSFSLNLPASVDAPLGLTIPHASDKALIWLNGLLVGQYWEQAGPQHTFYLPAGLLRERGRNTLALAVWNRGHDGGLTGGVSLQPYTVSAQTILMEDALKGVH
jgi:hypothetical protein